MNPRPAGAVRQSRTRSSPRGALPGSCRGQVWLPVTAIGLFALSAAAATVSYGAQYRLVNTARHLDLAAAMEASMLDAAMLVLACLGVALTVHGPRVIRARLLNLTSAGASVFMNVIAATPVWRNLAVCGAESLPPDWPPAVSPGNPSLPWSQR